MAEWGTRWVGGRRPSSEDEKVLHGAVYHVEAVAPTNIDMVAEMPLILALRDLPKYVDGVKVLYIGVEGNRVSVQWRAVSSPLAVGTVALAIIGIVFAMGIPLAIVSVEAMSVAVPESVVGAGLIVGAGVSSVLVTAGVIHLSRRIRRR